VGNAVPNSVKSISVRFIVLSLVCPKASIDVVR
jgi:hypothetical protein